MMNNHKINKDKAIACTHCGYKKNPATAVNCVKCGEPLNISLEKNSNKVVQPKPQSLDDWLSNPWTIRLSISLMFLFFSWLIYCLLVIVNNVNNSSETAVDSSSGSIENISDEIKLYNSIKDVPDVPVGTFNYGGATLFTTLTTNGLNEAIIKAHPNFRLVYTEAKNKKPGGRTGIAMLLNRQISFSNSAGPLRDEDYSKAQQQGFQLKQVPVAMDALVVFTHRDISIPGLSVEQVKDIYKGKLTNWKQVGGTDLPIIPFARDPQAANLLKELLRNEVNQLSSRVNFVRDYTDAIRQVSSTPGGISFGGNALIVNQQTIRPLAIRKKNSLEYVQPFIDNGKRINVTAIRDGSYPMTRRLFVVFRVDGTTDERAGEAYANILLSKEGQQIFAKAGFVPLR
jgi:phosphate transport system substrate-binding protein